VAKKSIQGAAAVGVYGNIADLLDHLDALVPCQHDGLRLLRPGRDSVDAAIRFIRNLERQVMKTAFG
jgi:hypothetical protein